MPRRGLRPKLPKARWPPSCCPLRPTSAAPAWRGTQVPSPHRPRPFRASAVATHKNAKTPGATACFSAGRRHKRCNLLRASHLQGNRNRVCNLSTRVNVYREPLESRSAKSSVFQGGSNGFRSGPAESGGRSRSCGAAPRGGYRREAPPSPYYFKHPRARKSPKIA